MPRDVRYQLLIDGQPDPGLTAEATHIEVVQSIEGPTIFTIRFATDVCDGDVAFMDDERLKPSGADTPLSVLAVVNGETFCVAHGVVTRRRGSVVEGGAGSWLEITGSDRRVVMDREERATHHSGKVSDAVRSILSTYGFELEVEETTVEYNEEENTLAQRTTDLAMVTQLAGRNDCHFWLDFEVDGTNITEVAHFRPSPARTENKPGLSLPKILAPDSPKTLKINSGDGCSNVFSFELDSDGEAPNQTGGIKRVDFDSAEEQDTEVGSPSTEPLGTQTNPPQPRTRRLVTAGTVEMARVANKAALNDAAWSVKAHAETSVFAFNGLVRAHDVVRVEGAGSVADGEYFVKSVTHQINPADHKLSIDLLRNALGGG
jgi:hypothetical protein